MEIQTFGDPVAATVGGKFSRYRQSSLSIGFFATRVPRDEYRKRRVQLSRVIVEYFSDLENFFVTEIFNNMIRST